MLKKNKNNKGFSLIELLITLAILLIVSAVIISAFTNTVKSLRRETSIAQRDSDVKRALQLMSLELEQAGTSPDILNTNSANPTTTTLQNATNVTATTYPSTFNNLSLSNTTSGFAVRGLYPGRRLILGLPEGSNNSQTLQVASLPNNCTNPCTISVTNNGAKNHPAATPVTSPALPIMFGILNPPPLTSGNLPLTATSKNVNRIGFIGDILSNGRLQYVEYTYDAATSRIYRSLTPLNPNDPDNAALNPNAPNKAPATVLLDSVLPGTQFTINYYSTTIPIPVSVVISIRVRSNVPERRTGAITFNEITSTLEIVPRATAAAALIFANGGEQPLRAMTPPCNGTGTGTGYPPCTGWNTNNWPWWNRVITNFTATNFNGMSQALP
ncbi:MAG: prepilin-type N-terminal cleavage/methylation domain-containing protein [Blastocatellia bacterium]|nr:prepilin-type N-terminal cleavage/methylation domain-containing protein [Blastocatellia bacterium]MBN8723679.1 prepilin-type N-terminal cleavage/methylation domain-containing protein [Acidobacteriota bacterium]